MAQGSAASASSPRKAHGADEPKPRSPRTVMVVDRISASPTVLEYERSLSAGRLSSDSATATASNDSAQAQLRVTRHGDELSSSADDEHGQRIPLDDDDRKIVSDGRMAGDHDDDESSHSSDASDSDGEGDENDDDDESTDDDGGDDEEDRDGQQEDFGLLDPVEVNDQRWSELSFDPFEEPDSPLNIILGAPLEGDDQPSIEAATVHKLIQRCTNHQVPGFDFLNTFVLMFEYASSSPADLMQLLAFRFDRVTTVPAAYSGEQIKTWERTYKLPRILRVINFFKVCHESQTKSTTSRERESVCVCVESNLLSRRLGSTHIQSTFVTMRRFSKSFATLSRRVLSHSIRRWPRTSSTLSSVNSRVTRWQPLNMPTPSAVPPPRSRPS